MHKLSFGHLSHYNSFERLASHVLIGNAGVPTTTCRSDCLQLVSKVKLLGTAPANLLCQGHTVGVQLRYRIHSCFPQ